MSLPIDRIYCVSLQRSTDRRQHARQELAAAGLGDFQFFDATDHDSPLVAEYRQAGAVATFPPCFRCGQRVCDCDNNVLIDAQVATFITYQRLWEDMIKHEVGVALVVEDDIKFPAYAAGLIRDALTPANMTACAMTPNSEALLRLGWALTTEHTWTGEYRFIKGLLKMSNPAFALTQAMARKLVSSFTSIDTTIDHYIHERVGLLAADNYTLMPPLAHDLSWSTGAFPSLIRPKPIHADYLRQTRPQDAEAIVAAEQSCAAQITRIEPRDILCVGHPRCGSAYMAHLLHAFGLDVGHEQLGAHGISSWMFAVDDDPYPFARNRGAERRRDKHFAAVIHHIRDPAEAIPSIMVENQYSAVSCQFRRRHILRELGIDLDACDSEIERAAVAYLAWNRLIERMNPQLVVRVEDGEESVRVFLMNQGFVPAAFTPGRLPPKDSNTNKRYQGKLVEKLRLQSGDWTKLTLATRENLRLFCRKHGYPEPGLPGL